MRELLPLHVVLHAKVSPYNAHLEDDNAVKRFHQYFAGRPFTIFSDHKPLQHLFQETSGIPTLSSARIERWALILGAYNYTIEYKPGAEHANADLFSRLPLPETEQSYKPPGEVQMSLNMLLSLPVTAQDIRTCTSRDLTLSKVRLMLSSVTMSGSNPITGDKTSLAFKTDVCSGVTGCHSPAG